MLGEYQQICKAIQILTQEEGDELCIFSANPEFSGPNQRIHCSARWTGYKDKVFDGDSLLDCMQKAVKSREDLCH